VIKFSRAFKLRIEEHMNIKGLLCLLLLMSVAPMTHAAEKPKKPVQERFDLNQVLQTVAREQDTDPVIGIWSSAAGGYSWRTAIIRNPNAASDGVEFIGIMTQALSGFRSGETHLKLNRTAAPGEYSGQQKWKGGLLFATRWATASFVFIDDYHILQTNNISFPSAIGTEWRLVRELPPALTQSAADSPSAPAADATGTRGRGRITQTGESQATPVRPAPRGVSPNAPAVIPEPTPAPEPTLAPIASPPPPTDVPPPPPKTISLGQTRDEVVAILGQPQKVVKLAAKEMLYYPDMKVILVNQKVTDVQ
jgi:hypothetical protein